jgi:hypothetical protein
MDHTEIDDGAWAERYVTDRLDADERQRFEAHFVDCATCLERIDAARGLRSGLTTLASKGQLAPDTRRARPRWARRATWLATGVVAAALLAALWNVSQRERQAESELMAERSAAGEAQRLLADSRASLEQERVARRQLETRVEQKRTSPTRVPLLVLLATRGGELPTLQLPDAPHPVVLSVEREDPPRFHNYRATLRSAAGEQRWQDKVAASSRDAVVLAVDSSLLNPGEYVLVLEGQAGGDRWLPVGRHTFRTVAADPAR